jgi:predicted nucleic acid-binding protein
MKVIVDTSVWSLALRRRAPAHGTVDELRRLVTLGRVAMLWAIRQELLSGVRDATAFRRLRDHLRAFADERLDHEDYERAAEHFNTCRAAGVQGSNTDFLLCAVAERRAFPILTTDPDFTRYAALLPVKRHPVEDARSQP